MGLQSCDYFLRNFNGGFRRLFLESVVFFLDFSAIVTLLSKFPISVDKGDANGKKKLALWEELWTELVPGEFFSSFLNIIFAKISMICMWFYF